MRKEIALPVDDYTLLRAVSSWEPRTEPHCSNCRFAIVNGGWGEGPMVSCAQGHGKAEITLFRLIRPKSPRGFRLASECPDFSSMSDEP